MLGRTIQHPQLLDTAVAQVPHALLAGCARADDQSAMIVHAAEDALRQLYPGERDRNRPRADLCLVANAFTHLERTLEHAVQYRASRAVIESDSVGFAHLSENFRFAQQHGVKARRDTKQMVHRTAIAVAIQ